MVSKLNNYNKNNQPKIIELKKLFNSLTLIQKISIALIFIIVIISIFMLVQWSSKPQHSVLYSGLNPEEAASVVEKLDDAKIDYELSDDGTIIKVESNELANARLTLAGEGVPYNSIVGFELFDQQFFGLTDFTQQVNYQRALEGELSRTISEISEVDSARVHLVLSEEDLFTEENTAASASIIVKLNDGAVLSSTSIQAIGNLAANAVKGLKLENISIVDTNGNLLSAGGEDDALLAEKQKMVREVEKEIEDSITNMLTRVFGSGSVIVSVKADMDFNKKQSETETYLTDEDGNGVVMNSTTLKENYDRSSSEDDTGGEAGTDSNVPQFEDADGDEEDSPVYAELTDDQESESNFYSKEESQIEYGVSRKIERIEYNGGEIEKLSIGIFLNADVPGDQIEDIKSVVASAAGIDIDRGDSISIKKMNFIDAEEGFAVEPVVETSIWQKIMVFGGKAWPGLLLIVIIMMLTLRARKNKEKDSYFVGEGTRRIGAAMPGRKPLIGRMARGKKYGSEESGVYETEDESESEDLKNLLGGSQSLKEYISTDGAGLTMEQKREKLKELRRRVLDRKNKNIYPELKELVAIEANSNPEIAVRVIENWLSDRQ
jgi:flagellar M-ring protein FliF